MQHERQASWQEAMRLVQLIYSVTENFPAQERYGLQSQMRRAAVSVASNLAEGSYRSSRKARGQFRQYAQGSLAELATQAEIAWRVGILDGDAAAAVGGKCRAVQSSMVNKW